MTIASFSKKKNIIKIYHLLRNEIIIIIINSLQNYNVILTKDIKDRIYNNLLLKQLVGIFKFIAMGCGGQGLGFKSPRESFIHIYA